MYELPDRRFYFLFVPLALLYLANAVLDSRAWTIVFYTANLLFGAIMALINVREGKCLHRPDITRSTSPLRFWLVVMIALCLVIGGAAGLCVALWPSPG